MGAGRPTSYRDDFAEQARKLTLLGHTDKELGEFFDVSEVTINAWKKEFPEFLKSIKEGKSIADADVAEALYKRAIGAQTYEERVIDGEVVGLVKTVPPDTQAASLWLRNRKPEKWRDKQEVAQDITSNGDKISGFTLEIVDPKEKHQDS